jgi:DNA polymerase (family 10)
LTLPTRIPLGRAYILASNVSRDIRRSGIPFDEVVPVGGIRRFAPDIGDVTLLGLAPPGRHAQILADLRRLSLATGIADQTASSLTLNTERGQVTIHVRPTDHAGAALVWHTGSREHLARLILRAAAHGLRFEGGELLRDGHALIMPSETDLYAALGLPFIPPELRQGEEELEAAEEGRLPQLVSDAHIRGDLHMHTTWSDGRDRVEDMVGVARQLGYEYIAITDHSQRSMSARKLSIDDVARQRAEIEDVRRHVSGIQILHGVEVDIMPDGTLDFDDHLLEGFEIVLASLHDHAGQRPETLSARYMSAVRHPLVNVITHPANRSPGASPGYDIDFDRLFDAAVATGTAVEVDGAPGHLDMDGALARRAIAAGVTVTIDSDSHRAEWLARQMRFGVGTARRGWVEPQHVLNARGVDAVRAFVARKRARA